VGIPGQGKSVTTTRIVEEFAVRGIPSIVLDLHGAFAQTRYGKGLLATKPIVANLNDGLPFSPFEADLTKLGANSASPAVNCMAVAEIFGYVCDLGPIQQDYVYRALRLSYGLDEAPESSSGPRPAGSRGLRVPSIDEVRHYLQLIADGKKADEVVARCRPLLDFGVFAPAGRATAIAGDEILRRGMILDVHDHNLGQCQVAAGAFLLRHIYKGMFQLDRAESVKLAVVVDEAHRLARDKTIPLLMKEGRKYGIAVVLASQVLADFPEEVIENSGSRIAFRTNSPNSRRTAELLSSDPKVRSTIQQRLESLNVGSAYVRTETMPEAMLVRMAR